MEKLEENVPPTKKLKQATLSFFKKTTPVVKLASTTPSANHGIKRKISNGPDSPNKIAKLSKPLVPAVTNADSPGSKVAKVNSKNLPCKKIDENEENDQEVSSSSEADAVIGKSSGKCCLMERFVVKLPQDAHQEISSTNEVLDVSVELSGDGDKSGKIDVEDQKVDRQEHNEEDCVIVEEDDGKIVSQNPEQPKDTADKSTTDSKSPNDQKSKASVVSESDVKSENADKAASVVLSIAKTPCKDNDVTKKSLLAISPITSTPVRKGSSAESPLNVSTPQSLNTSQSSAGETPVTSTKKRGRKIDSAKKAEREALKQKLKEEKEKAREEKKKQLAEEKLKKELELQEKKEAKEKEKQEKKEKLEQERLEKLKVKEDEKKKREEERLKKEEEKQKIIDAKQEEKRKKDEEKRLKEEEKQREEDEKKKKAEKSKQAFQSFFIKAKESEPKPVVSKTSENYFVPFEVKKDMHLAPAVRDHLSDKRRSNLDQDLQSEQGSSVNYLGQLKNGETKPHRTGRILRKNPQPEEEVEVMHDSEALNKVIHKVKLLQFHTDYRPPYYGTWRKQTALNPRKPWLKDEKTFDYEVDSDDEWEEEEPGESLSCSDGEGEEEKGEEMEEDEEGDGWMVPHGYLSEDEGCNEDDEITPEKLKLQQQAKAKAWDEEQKRKLQAAPLIAVGCFFENSPSPLMSGDVRLLYQFRGVVLAPVVPIPTQQNSHTEVEEANLEVEGTNRIPLKKGIEKKAVPDDAMPSLIQLVHGNTCGVKRLVREFRVFWLKKQEPPASDNKPTDNDVSMNTSAMEADVSVLSESLVESGPVSEDRESPEKSGDKDSTPQQKLEEGYGCCISKRQLEITINKIAVREKRVGFNKSCWYVKDDVMSQHNLTGLTLPNTWVFLSSGPVKASPTPNPNKNVAAGKPESAETVEEEKLKGGQKSSTDQKSIMAFTMSKEELVKQASLKPPKPIVSVESSIEEEKTKAVQKPTTDQKSIMAFTMSKQEIIKQASLKPKAIVSEKCVDSTTVSQTSSVDGSPVTPQNTKCSSSQSKETPGANKKPKMSILDMFMKKTPSSKTPCENPVKTAASVPVVTTAGDKIADVAIVAASPPAVTPGDKKVDVEIKEKTIVNVMDNASDKKEDTVTSTGQSNSVANGVGNDPIVLDNDSNDVIVLD